MKDEQKTCGSCSGAGRQPCPGCGGSGQKGIKEGAFEKGVSACAACGGRGTVTCRSCNGSGKR